MKLLRDVSLQSESSQTLDPENWDDIRAQGHRMLDDMLDYISNIRERPVWRPIPDEVRGLSFFLRSDHRAGFFSLRRGCQILLTTATDVLGRSAR